MGKWTVERTGCGCHPETCCCEDWGLYAPNGSWVVGFHSREDAEQLARELNKSLSDNINQLAREQAQKMLDNGMYSDQLAQLRDEVERLKGALEDARDTASIALRKAWQLGQTYWQQADSESFIQHAKSNETQARFQQLVDETKEEIWKGD